MIKDDLAKQIAAKFGLSLNLAGKIVQSFLDDIIAALAEGSRIELRRFGVFVTKKQKARVITLPSGKKVTRPARKIVTFAAGSTVKKLLNPPAKLKKPKRKTPSRMPNKTTAKAMKEKGGKSVKSVAALKKALKRKA